MAKINVKGTEIVFYKKEQEDYISLTDIAKVRDKENPSQIISLWLRTYSTIEYLGLWEMLNNPNFNPHIYEGFKNESAKPHFWMSPQKWITETNAIGMISKSGRYGGGTYAHSDIAFKYGKSKFRIYQRRTSAKRTFNKVKSDCHSANECVTGCRKQKIIKIII